MKVSILGYRVFRSQNSLIFELVLKLSDLISPHLVFAGFLWFLAIFIVYFFFSGFIWGAGYAFTPKRDIEIASNLMGLKEGMLVYDLGCGTGDVVCYLAKKYRVKCIGIEVDPLKVWISKLRISRNSEVKKRVEIKRKNFFAEDISEANAVYLFLSGGSGIMQKLRPKLASELRPDVRIASYFHLFKDVEPEHRIGNVRVYTAFSLKEKSKKC